MPRPSGGVLPILNAQITPPVTQSPGGGIKFHFSLNVSSIERSAGFYQVFFGQAAAKQYRDYAKFELQHPPVVFSLAPQPPSSGGVLNHLGLRLASPSDIVAVRQRLESAGLGSAIQAASSSDPAAHDRLWVADPDQTIWEVYVGGARGACTIHCGLAELSQRLSNAVKPAAQSKPVSVVWEHRVMQPIPARIPHLDGAVDEVRLQGLFNGDFSESARAALLAEVRRVLRPLGVVSAHGLAANCPFPDGPPTLPGIAALVKRVPLEFEPLEELEAAGFTGLHYTKFANEPSFRVGTVEMREIKLLGWKPANPLPRDSAEVAAPHAVIYRGPFAEAIADDGRVYPRGARVAVNAQTWAELGQGAVATQFEFIGDVQD